LPGLNDLVAAGYVRHGRAPAQAGRHDDALADFDVALQARPDDPDALAAKKQSTLQRRMDEMEAAWGKDDEAALAAAEEIFALDPGFREIRPKLYALLIAKADRLLAAGDRAAAVGVLGHAQEVAPPAVEARQRLLSLTPTPLPPPPPTAVIRQPAPIPAPPQQVAPPPAQQPAPAAPTATREPPRPAAPLVPHRNRRPHPRLLPCRHPRQPPRQRRSHNRPHATSCARASRPAALRAVVPLIQADLATQSADSARQTSHSNRGCAIPTALRGSAGAVRRRVEEGQQYQHEYHDHASHSDRRPRLHLIRYFDGPRPSLRT
jgi:tetratricopeptide (TPR) repeat protein